MVWSDIALPVGSADRRDFGMHLNFTLPEATCELPATDRQAEAVTLFYQTDFGELRDSQAHALLSCREYARLSAEAIFKRYPYDVRHILARALAAFLLSDAGMVRFATNWSGRNFARGTGSPRVKGTPFFSDLEQFASYLEGCLEMNGWTLAQLRSCFCRAEFTSAIKAWERPFCQSAPHTSASPLPFRVSDAGRRRKVDGARTRGPHALVYGDLSFGRFWMR